MKKTRTTTLTAASDNIAIALSGGVDSSVAAALLVDAGHTVTGVTCIFAGEMDAPSIPSRDSLEAAHAVAKQLGIEHVIVDVRERFERNVLELFACGYAQGKTPNPCAICNPSTKFGALIDAMDELGCDYLATGHYALVAEDVAKDVADVASPGADAGIPATPLLQRAVDPKKDQSYFLYRLTPEILGRLTFPLAGLTKDEVRAIAHEKNLPTAEAPESQDVCFADPEGGYASTIRRFAPEAFTPGEIVDARGNVLGEHTGIANYTVGQRKGLGIAAAQPLYVLAVDAPSNRVVVGTAEEGLKTEIVAHDVVLHAPFTPGDLAGYPDKPYVTTIAAERFDVKIRHGMDAVPATVTLGFGDTSSTDLNRENHFQLTCILDEPLAGIAPGQSLVCYRGNSVICGGIIV